MRISLEMNVVTVVSSLLSIFRMSTQQTFCPPPHQLTGGEANIGWLLRIILDGQTVGHGALVSKYRVLSEFWSFDVVARNPRSIKRYDFIAYEDKYFQTICYQMRKAQKIIPPPGWSPNTKLYHDVKDVAFWELAEAFKTIKDFPFLFPWNGPRGPPLGSSCHAYAFKYRDSWTDGRRQKLPITISGVNDCRTAVCRPGEVCNLGDRFDSCNQGSDPASDLMASGSWIRGAPVICDANYPSAYVSVSDDREKGKIRTTLIMNIQTAWEIFERYISKTTKMTIATKRTTATKPTTSTTPSTAMTGSTSNKRTEIQTTETKVTATHATATSAAENVSKTTASTIFTSKIPRHPTRQTTQMGTTFLRTRPKKVKVARTNSEGRKVVVNLGVLALCTLT